MYSWVHPNCVFMLKRLSTKAGEVQTEDAVGKPHARFDEEGRLPVSGSPLLLYWFIFLLRARKKLFEVRPIEAVVALEEWFVGEVAGGSRVSTAAAIFGDAFAVYFLWVRA